jgi:hypothetical protein
MEGEKVLLLITQCKRPNSSGSSHAVYFFTRHKAEWNYQIILLPMKKLIREREEEKRERKKCLYKNKNKKL